MFLPPLLALVSQLWLRTPLWQLLGVCFASSWMRMKCDQLINRNRWIPLIFFSFVPKRCPKKYASHQNMNQFFLHDVPGVQCLATDRCASSSSPTWSPRLDGRRSEHWDWVVLGWHFLSEMVCMWKTTKTVCMHNHIYVCAYISIYIYIKNIHMRV